MILITWMILSLALVFNDPSGWQIDPFGHSLFHAWLSKEFGFTGISTARIDFQVRSMTTLIVHGQHKNTIFITVHHNSVLPYSVSVCLDQDLSSRLSNKSLDMIWNLPLHSSCSSSSCPLNQILFSVLPQHYGFPESFCIDLLCPDTPFQVRRFPRLTKCHFHTSIK